MIPVVWSLFIAHTVSFPLVTVIQGKKIQTASRSSNRHASLSSSYFLTWIVAAGTVATMVSSIAALITMGLYPAARTGLLVGAVYCGVGVWGRKLCDAYHDILSDDIRFVTWMVYVSVAITIAIVATGVTMREYVIGIV